MSSSLLLLVLKLVVLRLAQNICSSLVRFLISGVQSMTVLRVVNRFVKLRICKEVRVVLHVRVWVVVLVLPALASDIAHFLLIVYSVVCVRCDICCTVLRSGFFHDKHLALIALYRLVNLCCQIIIDVHGLRAIVLPVLVE